MSDFGIFESDEAAQDQPRLAAKTAAMKLQAAVEKVQSEYGRFLLGATGIDEFEDRWHLSKADIRKTIEPFVFPNTGTMRRIQNAMKADWKLAHPYKVAGPHDSPEANAYWEQRSKEKARQSQEEWDNRYQGGPLQMEKPEGFQMAVDMFPDLHPQDSWEKNIADRHGLTQLGSYREALSHDEAGFGSMPTGDGHRNQHLEQTYHPSSGNLIPDGDFEGYKDSVDQDGPEKVESNDFTPGGDSGKHAHRMVAKVCAYCNEDEATGTSPDGKPECKYCHNSSYAEDDDNKKEAARLVADIYTDFARSNGMRVASLDTLDHYASTGIAESDYRLLESMIVRAAAAEDEESEEEPEEDDHEEPDTDDEGGPSDGDEDNEDEDDDESDSDDDGDEDYDFGGDDEGDDEGGESAGGGQQFTVPEQAPDLDPQLLNEIPHDDTDGSAPVPPEVIDSLLGLPEGTIEQLLLQEVEQGQGGAPQGGGDDFFGGGGGDAEQEPPRVARRRRVAKDYGRKCPECKSNNTDYSPSSNDYDCYDCGATFKPYSNSKKSPEKESSRRQAGGAGSYYDQMEQADQPRSSWMDERQRWENSRPDWKPFKEDEDSQRRQNQRDSARRFWAAPDESEGDLMARQRQQHQDALDTKFGPAPTAKPDIRDLTMRAQNGDGEAYATLKGLWKDRGWTAARRFWAADDDQSEGGEGGGEQAPAGPPAGADPAAMGGDPSAMGGGMMPPPGSASVAPPQPPQPIEDQPAEDALLDTANQAIMQMIDRETQEYQQIIGPLSQALQAVQFAQQVEQSEHPMDVTPPQGTVNVDPSQAPGGAQNPMQPTARRRRTATPDRKGPWTDITYHQGDDYNEMADMGPEEMFHHMKQWDYGDDDNVRDEAPWGTHDRLHSFNDGNLEYVLSEGDGGAGLVRRPLNYQREAKIVRTLKNAARLIGKTYNVNSGMLIEAMGRREYEHVAEAFQILPPEARQDPYVRAAARHIAKMFAAENTMFNEDAFMADTVGPASGSRLPFDSARAAGIRQASDPRDREWDAWASGRDHLSSRTAGENQKNTPTLDAFEWENDQPKISDNMAINDLPKQTFKGLPKMKAYREADIGTKVQNWMKRQTENGLNMGGDTMVHRYINEHKQPASQRGINEVHEALGITPEPPANNPAPKEVAVPKAKNPVTKKGTWGEWEPTREASFFTRKVPGWKWDDHLSGYISKEGKAFTCSCGQKVAAPSYKTCDCGKIWNVYAIGDTHHLGSNTAEMFIAREIPVRPGVVMANRKLAAPHRCPNCGKQYADWQGYCKHCDYDDDMIADHHDDIVDDWWSDPDGDPDPFDPRTFGASRKKTGARAQQSHAELVAMIDKLADWTKYDDDVDPAVEAYGKNKVPSTKVRQPPQDWAKRKPAGDPGKQGGTWTPPTIPRKKK